MKSSKSSLFLMELILSILFFSVTSAACIQLFVKAHLLDNQTKEQNQSVIWSQNLAELWYSFDGEIASVYEQLCTDYPDAAITLTDNGDNLTLYFTKDWEFCKENNISGSIYRIELAQKDFDTETMISTAELSFQKNQEPFYELPLSLHIASERGTEQ